MSQPPKSTIFAPEARCTALSGVWRSMASPGRKKGRHRPSDSAPSVLLPERLRHCVARSAGCPFGGPPCEGPAALQIDCCRPHSPGYLSDCGSCAFGGGPKAALSCTGAPRLPAPARVVKDRGDYSQPCQACG